jgi:leader peptidase (prepilin peptidase) / N-methyltransferase
MAMTGNPGDVRVVELCDGVFVAVPRADEAASASSTTTAAEAVAVRPPRRAWHVPHPALLPAAALATVAVARLGADAHGLLAAATVAVLVVLSAIDLRWRLLPNAIVLPATALVLAGQIALAPGDAAQWLGASVGAGALLLLPALVRPGGLGMGDVKLAALMGALLGAQVIAALVVAFLSVWPVALVLFARYGAAARHRALPLGPFLTLGAIVVLLA